MLDSSFENTGLEDYEDEESYGEECWLEDNDDDDFETRFGGLKDDILPRQTPSFIGTVDPAARVRGVDKVDLIDHLEVYRGVPIVGGATSGTSTSLRIRLLQIHPGSLDEPAIHGTLLRRELYDAPAYDALSCTWGTEPPSREIFLGADAQSFPITSHLWKAIRRLRHARVPVYVWIDAICIDQQNYVERAAQVSIMAQIYDQASRVRIWLSDNDLEGVQGHSFATILGLERKDSSPWWKRLWVLQECAYANECPIIMLGSLEISMEEMVHRWALEVQYCREAEWLEQAQILESNLHEFESLYQSWLMGAKLNKHRLPLLKRLHDTIGQVCKEPLDRVFAIISLVDEDEARLLKPDYRVPYPQLLEDVELILRRSPSWTSDIGNKVLLDLWSLEMAELKARDNGLSEMARIAVSKKYHGLVRVLLETGARVPNIMLQAESAKGHDNIMHLVSTMKGFTDSKVLKLAIEHGWEDVALEILARGPDLSDLYDHTEALRMASANGAQRIVERLLVAGSSQNVPKRKYSSAMEAASFSGHETIVTLLLDNGVPVDAGGDDGTALQAASSQGHKEIVVLLLDRGADVYQSGRRYGTALEAAVKNGHKETVEILLRATTDLSMHKDIVRTLLDPALKFGHEEIVQMLLRASFDSPGQEDNFDDLLKAASARGSVQVVMLLLQNALVKSEHKYGAALSVASREGRMEIVKMLLDAGADIHASSDTHGTALQAASSGNHCDIAELLLAEGADVRAVGGYYNSAIQAASAKGYFVMVQILLDHGAFIDAPGGFYGSPLQAASYNGHVSVVKLLLDSGADIHGSGGLVGGALQAASLRGHNDVVKLLLKHGINVNARGGMYETPLIAASFGGQQAVVKVLLDAGADVKVGSSLCDSALWCAAKVGDETIVKMLLEKREKHSRPDAGILFRASTFGRAGVVKILLDAGANANDRGKDDAGYPSRALYAAADGGHFATVEILLRAGAKVDAKGGQHGGTSALEAAGAKGFTSIVKLLIEYGARERAR